MVRKLTKVRCSTSLPVESSFYVFIHFNHIQTQLAGTGCVFLCLNARQASRHFLVRGLAVMNVLGYFDTTDRYTE